MKSLKRYKWAVVTLGYIAIIFLLSFRPQLRVKHNFIKEILYNCAHIPLYGMLGYFLLILFKNLRMGKLAFICAIICGMVVAAADEFFQSLVPGRTASVMDLGLDLIGLHFGCWILLLIRSMNLGKNNENS